MIGVSRFGIRGGRVADETAKMKYRLVPVSITIGYEGVTASRSLPMIRSTEFCLFHILTFF